MTLSEYTAPPDQQQSTAGPGATRPTAGRESGLAALYALGAHFTLCDAASKRPVWPNGSGKGWNRKRPALDAVLSWSLAGYLVGVIPVSLGLTALDVDAGDPYSHLIPDHPPLAVVSSNRPGRVHAYYPTPQTPVRDADWALAGCSGQVRHRGNLILWHDAPQRLAAALATASGQGEQLGFPAGVLDGLSAAETAMQLRGLEVWTTADLSAVKSGERNKSVFDATRHWAYYEPRSPTYDEWLAKCRAVALEARAQIPLALPAYTEAEALRTAKSVAQYTFGSHSRRSKHWNASPSAQRSRGRLSGMARRERTEDRDREIVDLAATGTMSQRAISAQYGISQSAVSYILKRDRKAREWSIVAPMPTGTWGDRSRPDLAMAIPGPGPGRGPALNNEPKSLGALSAHPSAPPPALAPDLGWPSPGLAWIDHPRSRSALVQLGLMGQEATDSANFLRNENESPETVDPT